MFVYWVKVNTAFIRCASSNWNWNCCNANIEMKLIECHHLYYDGLSRQRCRHPLARPLRGIGQERSERIARLAKPFGCVRSCPFGVRFPSSRRWFARGRKSQYRQLVGHHKERHRSGIRKQSQSHRYSGGRFDGRFWCVFRKVSEQHAWNWGFDFVNMIVFISTDSVRLWNRINACIPTTMSTLKVNLKSMYLW